MAPINITNPDVIKFLVESYERENRLRVAWIDKNPEKFNPPATTKKLKGHYEIDVIAHNMEGGMASITRDHVVAGYNRRKRPIRDGIFIPSLKDLRHGHPIVDIGLGSANDDPRLQKSDKDLSPNPIMRPVDPELTKLIYNDTLPLKAKYLKERAKIWPEKRYYFPECVNWDYGWRMKDSKASTKCVYGKSNLLKKSLQSRTGAQPDPSHYKEAVKYIKCSKN